MSFKVTEGISQAELSGWLEAAAKKFGTFDDGRINYKSADIAPAVMCVLAVGGEFLLVKRGYGLADANGVWSIINGFIDEPKPVSEIAHQEFVEELSIHVPAKKIKVAKSLLVKDNGEKRAYIIFPCLVQLAKKPDIKLEREHTDYAWIRRSQLEKYEFLPDLPVIVDRALALSSS